MKYTYLSIFKKEAKAFANQEGIKLHLIHDRFASEVGFRDYHELKTVANRHPDDLRLVVAAFGTDSLGDQAVYNLDTADGLDLLVEDRMSSEIASTNAYGFMIDGIESLSWKYDQRTGKLCIETAIEYNGEQDTDRTYVGCKFELKAYMRLKWRGDKWIIDDDEDPLEIIYCQNESDKDAWRE